MNYGFTVVIGYKWNVILVLASETHSGNDKKYFLLYSMVTRS